MPTTAFDPGPRQRDRSPAVGDGHQQQLMPKAHLAAIHDQAYLIMGHLPYDGPGDRLIPLSHSDCRVGQQPLDAPCFAGQTCQTRHFPSDLARMYTTALVQTYQQPDEIAPARNPFIRPQLAYQFVPCMVKFFYRHDFSRCRFVLNHTLLDNHAVFIKLSGS